MLWEIGLGWNIYLVGLVDICLDASNILEYLEIHKRF
jgi:hypothetical protein